MAVGYGPERAQTSEGGGGGIHYDPNDISNARPVYDPVTGQVDFIMPDGTRLGGNGQGQNGNSPYGPYSGQYQNDPNQMPPTSLQNNPTYYGPGGGGATGAPGGGGGGGGLPLALKKLLPLAALAPSLRNVFGGDNGGNANTQIPPELQQLLQMSLQRMTSQDPLFRSINAQAMAGLPTAYQRS